MERKIIQFLEGSRGRKFSPNPRYFHIGFGGLTFAAGLASVLMSAFAGVEVDFYGLLVTLFTQLEWGMMGGKTTSASGTFESAIMK
jgi:hypothetical protein